MRTSGGPRRGLHSRVAVACEQDILERGPVESVVGDRLWEPQPRDGERTARNEGRPSRQHAPHRRTRHSSLNTTTLAQVVRSMERLSPCSHSSQPPLRSMAYLYSNRPCDRGSRSSHTHRPPPTHRMGRAARTFHAPSTSASPTTRIVSPYFVLYAVLNVSVTVSPASPAPAPAPAPAPDAATELVAAAVARAGGGAADLGAGAAAVLVAGADRGSATTSRVVAATPSDARVAAALVAATASPPAVVPPLCTISVQPSYQAPRLASLLVSCARRHARPAQASRTSVSGPRRHHMQQHVCVAQRGHTSQVHAYRDGTSRSVGDSHTRSHARSHTRTTRRTSATVSVAFTDTTTFAPRAPATDTWSLARDTRKHNGVAATIGGPSVKRQPRHTAAHCQRGAHSHLHCTRRRCPRQVARQTLRRRRLLRSVTAAASHRWRMCEQGASKHAESNGRAASQNQDPRCCTFGDIFDGYLKSVSVCLAARAAQLHTPLPCAVEARLRLAMRLGV